MNRLARLSSHDDHDFMTLVRETNAKMEAQHLLIDRATHYKSTGLELQL